MALAVASRRASGIDKDMVRNQAAEATHRHVGEATGADTVGGHLDHHIIGAARQQPGYGSLQPGYGSLRGVTGLAATGLVAVVTLVAAALSVPRESVGPAGVVVPTVPAPQRLPAARLPARTHRALPPLLKRPVMQIKGALNVGFVTFAI